MSGTFSLDAPLSRIIVLGGRAASETIARFANAHAIKVAFFVGECHRDLPALDGNPLDECLAELGHEVRYTDDILDYKDGPYATPEPGTLVLSLSTPFAMDDALLALHGGRVVNAHATTLPRYRGGGGFSWPILTGDRRGAVTLHQVTNAWGDDGPLIVQEPFEFPADLRYPSDYEAHMQRLEGPVIEGFLDGLRRGETFPLTPQDENAAIFMPRLHTPSQAHIDWSWSGAAIERFVLAFSHPYAGAMTLVQRYDGEFPAKHHQEFLDYLDITDDDLWEVIDSWRQPHIWTKEHNDWRLNHAVFYPKDAVKSTD